MSISPGEKPNETTHRADVEVKDSSLLLRLSGPGGAHLHRLEGDSGVSLGLRGNIIQLRGTKEGVLTMQRVLKELLEALQREELNGGELEHAAKTMRKNPNVSLGDFYQDAVLKTSSRRVIAPKGLHQQQYVHAMREHDVVFGIGPAGTGKTYLAMAMAMRALQERRVKRIILARPAVEAGERLGFLPGDLAEKINPYLRPLYDALHDMMETEQVSTLMERGVIEVAPLAFMRGRTLNESFVILDEAQNTTLEQMKMFLTRLGFESKAVITGDITQVDLPSDRKSGLHDALDVLQDVQGLAFVRFTDADVVRHPLVQRIVQAYDRRDAAKQDR